MDDNILNKKIIVNGEVYLNGDVILEFLRQVFKDVKSGYEDNALDNLSNNMDILLEVIEYNDGEE